MSSTQTKNLTRYVGLTAVALVGVLTPASAFGSSTSPKPAATQIIKASQQSPQMVIPGDIVDVALRTGTTRVQLEGPVIPQLTADALPGTFIFSFDQLKGSTVINIRDFGILDGDDALIRPIKFDDGSTMLTLKAGERKTLKLTTFMAVGTGTLRWAPLNHYVADWQFVEETA